MATKANSVMDKPMEVGRMLIVSTQPSDVRPIWELARARAWQCEAVASAWEALEQTKTGSFDLVLLDLHDDADALHTLRWLRYASPTLSVVLIANSHDHWVETEALRLGARACLRHPLRMTDLESMLSQDHPSRPSVLNSAPMPELICEAIERFGEDLFFVCATPAMQKLRVHAESLAQVDAPLLIVGEAGSGKECTARLIHQLSMRSGFPFIKIDCAAYPGDLLEAELFGSENGHPGKLELAEKGVVYLEDISALPPALQARLLHVMQEKCFTRAHIHSHGNGRVRVEARILAAASPDAEAAVSQGRLRRDLYYRLSAFSVQVPPLRQCREAIPLLLGYFMSRMAKQYGIPGRTLSPALLQACQSHPWRGNVSELRDFAKRYLVVGDEELALWELKKHSATQTDDSHSDLSWHVAEGGMQGTQTDGLKSLVRDIKGETERNAIANALEETHWNRKAAARLLRISYRTLLYKIQSYAMTPPPVPMIMRQSMKRDERAE